ncbi:hotdog family protein [Methyloglobulus sp.]|uniref:hotdog family protein n=1 Tax=Methyloglobulus sp. TaxID=2518622 RepID=UPI0032B7CDCF
MIDYNDVASLIPHSGQLVLLDKVVEFNDEKLVAEMTVRGDGLFGNDKNVPAWAGIEYMAQAVGVYAGIKSKLAGEPIKLGYLLGTRRFSSNVASFVVGTELTINVKVIIQDDKLGAFDCQILGDGIEVSANLTVYQPPIDIELKGRS